MAEAAATVKDMGILLVDDEAAIVRYLSALLRKGGFHNVFTAGNATDALHYFGLPLDPRERREQPPTEPRIGLVLLDIVLPDMSGFDVCLRLKREMPGYLPVMLLTGYHIEDDHALYIESGADDFLLKPIQPAELLARVGVMLRRKQKLDQDQQQRREAGFAPVHNHPAVGQVIGKYAVADTLSWSGSAVVYRASLPENRGPCVIKILTPHATDYSDVVARFERESQVMQQLKHPNIIRAFDAGEHEGCPWYAMEYIDGPHLEHVLQKLGPADFNLVVTVARSLAVALRQVHALGVIHRDVKPKNICLTQDGIVKLGDFGIAVRMGEQRLTQRGFSIGTPVYMSPEQFEGRPVAETADIYSLGATLYHLITGQPPFSARNAVEMLNKHLATPPAPMRERRPAVPAAWDEFIVKECLAKKPVDRPPNMHAVIAALDELENQPF